MIGNVKKVLCSVLSSDSLKICLDFCMKLSLFTYTSTGTEAGYSEMLTRTLARLKQVRTDQHERLAAESAKEKEARLIQVRADQHERLAAESAEEREAKHKFNTTIHITSLDYGKTSHSNAYTMVSSGSPHMMPCMSLVIHT